MIRKRYAEEGDELLAVETPEWSGVIDLTSGGNLIRLRYRPEETEILRSPRSFAELRAKPECFGTPLLLPPNRIGGGRFRANGRDYSLPLNEPETDSHLHGLVLGRAWQLQDVDADSVAVSYLFDRQRAEYSGFPHEFRLMMRFRFAPESVEYVLAVENTGSEAMPLGVGFHTAFALPPEESATVTAPHGDGFWEVHPTRRLPTGRLLAWDSETQGVLDGTVAAASVPVAKMFPVDGGHEALIRRKKLRIRYVFDEKYLHLACWNDGGGKDFFCIEPMSWMTNAPNLELPPEISGFSMLEGGKTRTFRSEFRIET